MAWLTAAVLLLFTLRRWLFVLVALLLPDLDQPGPAGTGQPHVLLLAPVRNEGAALPGLLQALDRLDYPAASLTGVLIDDGSTDGSGVLMQRWAGRRANWQVLALPKNLGKAGALNQALAVFPQGEVVAIYDADERPLPGTLKNLVAPFDRPQVGGASGRRVVANALASPAAAYATFEGLVHQLVTLRAKDRLNLAPPLLGSNCAYRRAALAAVGNFKPGALLEDSDLTLKLARAGWQTRFVSGAVSYHAAPATIAGYWRQHTRWARGFNEVAGAQAGSVAWAQAAPLALRLELLIFALGYLDRLALLAGGMLLLFRGRARRRLAWLVGASLLTPLFQVAAALWLDRAPAALWARLVWLPPFFCLDLAMAVSAGWAAVRRSPQIWEERRTRR